MEHPSQLLVIVDSQNPVVSSPIHQRNEAIGFPAVTMRDSSQTAR
jgi:hypothetical protein